MRRMTPWRPWSGGMKHWLPVQDSKEGCVEAEGLTGFYTREECQAECDRRNADLFGEVQANIDRLERELEEQRVIYRAHIA